MISAYGPAAQRFAARLPSSLDAVIAEAATVAWAYRDAVDRRTTGKAFFTALLAEDMRVDVTRAAARTFLGLPWDQQRQQLDILDRGSYSFNGRPAAETWVVAEATRRISLDFMNLGDALLVRSMTEYERLSTATGRRRMNLAIVADPPNNMPSISPLEGTTVVIWAPYVIADALAHLVLSLSEIRLPIIAVVQSGTLPNVRAQFVTYDEEAAVAILSRALCIVDADTADAGIAQAVARACPTVPLVVASTSGAREFLDNVSSYVPWSRASVYGAVCGAFGTGAPRRRVLPAANEQALSDVLRATEPELITGPLVSIIVPTFNRRTVLPQLLTCVERQSYENVECIVVNDAGEDISDVVANFPRSRLITLSENVRGIRAANTGLRAAKGVYVIVIGDDDVLYPDHVARNVSALERSGLGVSSSNIVVRHIRTLENGTQHVSAFNAETFSYTVDPTEVLCSSPIAGQALFMRRALLEEIGLFAEDVLLADQEVQIRLMAHTNFAHVDRFTGEWTIFEDPTWHFSHQKANDFPDDLRRVYAKHPVAHRPLVDAMRAQVIRNVEARPPNAVFAPTVTYEPT